MGELTPAELDLWNRFYTARRQLDRALERDLQADSAVSAAEFEIMRALSHADGFRMRVREIVETVNWEQSRVSHQLTRMVERGIIVKESDPDDGRTTWIRLTPEAHANALEAMPARTERMRTYFFGVLTPEEQALIGDISDRILAAVRGAEDPAGG